MQINISILLQVRKIIFKSFSKLSYQVAHFFQPIMDYAFYEMLCYIQGEDKTTIILLIQMYSCNVSIRVIQSAYATTLPRSCDFSVLCSYHYCSIEAKLYIH